jgi:hypothetical protein
VPTQASAVFFKVVDGGKVEGDVKPKLLAALNAASLWLTEGHAIGLSKKARSQRARVQGAAKDQKAVGRLSPETTERRKAEPVGRENLEEEA